jgi:hypothetical protein
MNLQGKQNLSKLDHPTVSSHRHFTYATYRYCHFNNEMMEYTISSD